MTDDVEDVRWADLPQAAKIVVYEHLRQMAAQARTRTAEASLFDVVSTDGLGREATASEKMHALMSEAFESACEELERADPALCQACGIYHNDLKPHPKDLS